MAPGIFLNRHVSDESVVYADDEIEITCQSGSNRKAVVAFTGVGFALGGIQIEEFRKSLSGEKNQIVFVKEKSRHWYNSSFTKTLDILNSVLIEMDDVSTIGNSMGGFAAIAFSSLLNNCNISLAFSAQSAVDPNIISWEKRYDDLIGSVKEWNGLDATKLLSNNVNYVLVYGGNDSNDVKHAQRFYAKKHDTMSLYILENCGHDVVAYLKGRGRLQPLIDKVIFEQAKCLNHSRVFNDLPMQLDAPRKNCV